MKYLFFILVSMFILFLFSPYIFPNHQDSNDLIYNIDLSKSYQGFDIKSDIEESLRNHLTIRGKCDCNVTIEIQYLSPFTFKKGETINVDESYDWYDQSTKVKIWSKGCTKESNLFIKCDII